MAGRNGEARTHLVLSLVSRVRSAVDSICNFQDHEGQLQQKPHDEDTDKQSHDSHHQIDESLRGGMLHADHDAGHDRDSAAKDRNDIEQLHDPTGEQGIEREIKKSRKEILFILHVASWQKFRETDWGRDVGKAIRRHKSRRFDRRRSVGPEKSARLQNFLEEVTMRATLAPSVAETKVMRAACFFLT